MRALHTDSGRGLDAPEALRRLATHGRNELAVADKTPAWRRMLAQLRDPLVYLLLAAIAVSLLAWWVDSSSGWPVDALVIAAVVVVNLALSFWQDEKAIHAVAALAKMTSATSSVMRGGASLRVPSAELVPGDLLLLAEGDAVGADARLVSVVGLRAKEDSLTGESEAVVKDPVTLAAVCALGDRTNMVFKGTSIVQGHGSALVVHTGMASQVGAIAAMLDATTSTPTPLQTEIAHIGRTLAIAVVVIATVVVATIVLLSDDRSLGSIVAALLLGVSLAVAAVPEGLPAILSVVLAMGVQRMARRHAIMKTLPSVESLGAVSVICTDKTGTLTRSEMTIERALTASGAIELGGVGFAVAGDIRHDGAMSIDSRLRSEMITLLGGGSLASNAVLTRADAGLWSTQGDPTEVAILVAENKIGARDRRMSRFERIGEIPFSAERKLMSVIARDHDHDDALRLVCKGAPDVLLGLCTHVRIGEDVLPMDAARRSVFVAGVEGLSGAALRTLAVAYRPLSADEAREPTETLEHDLVFVGVVGMRDPPRPEVAPAIAEARRAGVRVVMITGDHPRTALRIALDLGIVETDAAGSGRDPVGGVLDGAALDGLDDAALADAVHRVSVFARVSPAHKLRIVAALQANGHVVAMTGDGVNDAPALKAADIGIAMGITGTEVAKQSARMILADDNFATIVAAVRDGRAIFDNIRKFMRYLLTGNIGEVLTVFLGVVGAGVIGLSDGTHAGVVFPLLATQILWINLMTDSWPALAMGIDPPVDDVMARKPRPLGQPVIDARMWRGVFGMGLVMAMITLLAIDIYLPGGLVDGGSDLATARTAGFTVLVLAQLMQAFNARSNSASVFRRPFSNPWLWAAVALSGALQVAVVQLPLFNLAFGTKPLTLVDWLLCVTLASMVLWASELAKWFRRRSSAGASL